MKYSGPTLSGQLCSLWHSRDVCKATTASLCSRSSVFAVHIIVKSGVLPPKLSSGLFRSTITVLGDHDCGFSAVSELLSGPPELLKINFKARMCGNKETQQTF